MIMVSLGTLPVTPKLILVKGVGQCTAEGIHNYLLKCVKQFPEDYNDLIADAPSVYTLLYRNGVFKANLEAMITLCPPSLEEQETIVSQDDSDVRHLRDWFYGLDRIIEMNWYNLVYRIIYGSEGLETTLWQFITDNSDEINHYQAEAYADESADRTRKDC